MGDPVIRTPTSGGDSPRPERRRFLRSIAAATGLVWAAPAVTSLGVPAHAQTSPPPQDVEVQPTVLEREPTEVAGARITDGLPRTGPDIAAYFAAGTAAAAAGAAALRAKRRGRGEGGTEPTGPDT